MTKSSGLGDNLYVGGYDLSGDVGSVTGIHGGPALLEVTGIDKSAPERIGGIFDGGLGFNAFYNAAAGQAHPVLSALPTTDVNVMYCRGTTLGSPAALLTSKQIDYAGTRGQDGALAFSVNAVSNGFGLEWGRLLTAGKRTDTSATNGTAIESSAVAAAVAITSSSIANPTVITTAAVHLLSTGHSIVIAGHTGSTPAVDGSYGASVTGASTFTVPVNVSTGGTGGTVTRYGADFGASAYLQVFAFSGTDVTVKLQHSSDNVTFVDVTGGAFSSVTTGPQAQRIQTTATLQMKRYLRAVTVTTGGFTSVTFAVAVLRHQTATL